MSELEIQLPAPPDMGCHAHAHTHAGGQAGRHVLATHYRAGLIFGTASGTFCLAAALREVWEPPTSVTPTRSGPARLSLTGAMFLGRG